MTSGFKHFLIEGFAWLALVVSVFSSVFYFDELKSGARFLMEQTDAQAEEMASKWDRIQTTARTLAHEEEQKASNYGRTVHLTAGRRGHFYARAWINGRQINVMVDTGATGVALTAEDAENVGIFVGASDFTHISRTANGTAKIAPVTLDSIRIGDIEVDNVRAYVGEPGRMHMTLLGMTFLRKLSQVEFKGDKLVLTQ